VNHRNGVVGWGEGVGGEGGGQGYFSGFRKGWHFLTIFGKKID